jgi:fructose-1,6-bisphosphatase II
VIRAPPDGGHYDPHVAVAPDRNLALELVRVTEAAALAAARWVGRGDKNAADGAAVDAMRHMLSTVPMDGIVVIGEGEKDEAPMLFNGERIGDGTPPEVDIAVDPLEGTSLVARGQPNALAVVALAERGTMFDPGPTFYMEKIAGGEDVADLLSLTDPVEDVLARVADRRGVEVGDLMVVILDRPRHAELVARVRAVGARIRFIPDGDVAGALMAVRPGTGIDLLLGIGGTPEGVLAAAAIKATGGAILGRLWPRDDAERAQVVAAGLDPVRVLTTDDLVGSDNCFFAATGVTDGDILRGVRFERGTAVTQSMVMRSRSGTVRVLDARHQRSKLRGLAGTRYG